jgi:hypothetical protein
MNARGTAFAALNKGADDAFSPAYRADLDAFAFTGPDGRPFTGTVTVSDIGYLPRPYSQHEEWIQEPILTFWLEPAEGEAEAITVTPREGLEVISAGRGGCQVRSKAGVQWFLHRRPGGLERYLQVRERPSGY